MLGDIKKIILVDFKVSYKFDSSYLAKKAHSYLSLSLSLHFTPKVKEICYEAKQA